MAHAVQSDAARRALESVLDALGRAPDEEDVLDVTGEEPTLPTCFPIAAATAGVLGACGLCLSDLWRLRTGHGQAVTASLRGAAAALRSVQYLGFADGGGPPTFDPLFGYYPTGDGRWVQLHTNFPHTRDRALAVLGAAPEREEVARAVLGWEAHALERVLDEAGACAAFVRTPREWREHPHAAAVASLPLIEIERIGDAPPEPLPAGARPLDGVRALDLTRVLAGPTCGRTLAEQGAEVMRISAAHLPSVERCVIDTGHGKLTAEADLGTAEGRSTVLALAREADVFCQAYRPGTLAARGFGPEDIARLRPGIVYVSLSAYGRAGPWAHRRGYDTLVQSSTGIAHEHGAGPDGAPGDEPRHLPGAALDYITGFLAAAGVARALARRADEGGSYQVTVSLCRTAHWLNGFERVDEARAASVPLQGPGDVADLMVESETAWGRLRHLGPAVGLAETPGRWVRPVSPLGAHAPRWYARGAGASPG